MLDGVFDILGLLNWFGSSAVGNCDGQHGAKHQGFGKLVSCRRLAQRRLPTPQIPGDFSNGRNRSNAPFFLPICGDHDLTTS
jgi:hypothetical protein